MPQESGYRAGAGLLSLAGFHDYSGRGRESVDKTVTVLATLTAVLESNPQRNWALLTNVGAVDVFLSFGGNAALNTGVYLKAGGGWALLNENMPWSGAITGISSGAGSTVTVLEVSLQSISQEPITPAPVGSSNGGGPGATKKIGC